MAKLGPERPWVNLLNRISQGKQMATDLDPRLQHKHHQQPRKPTHRNTVERKLRLFQTPDWLSIAVLFITILCLPFIQIMELGLKSKRVSSLCVTVEIAGTLTGNFAINSFKKLCLFTVLFKWVAWFLFCFINFAYLRFLSRLFYVKELFNSS